MQMKRNFRKIQKAVAVFLLSVAVAACFSSDKEKSAPASAMQDISVSTFSNQLNKEETAPQTVMPQVYPCGFPVGIYMETAGVMVVTPAQIPTNENSLSSPCEGSLEQGDYITSVNGVEVNSKEELIAAVENCNGQPLTLHVIREQSESDLIEREFDLSVLPVLDANGSYRLGVWVKDDVQGIGTLTYITEDGHFGALGHPINDSDTGKRVHVRKGGLYESQIQMVIRGKNGTPGSFCGIICYDGSTFLGNIYENNACGIYGNSSVLLEEQQKRFDPMPVAKSSEVVCGSAILRCAVSDEPQDYEVEVIKTQPGSSGGFQIRVTDQTLLEKTGGIIQGMSGSPLIQNGKVIGAVTHVFVNDPTRGYAIYMEDMLGHTMN